MATRTRRSKLKARRVPRPKRITPEGAVLREVLDFLAAHRILAFRMNVGVAKYGSAFVRYGLPGMSDVVAFPHREIAGVCAVPFPFWIEAKAGAGKQSHEQKMFQQVVEGEKHWYLVVKDSYELENFLKSKGVIK